VELTRGRETNTAFVVTRNLHEAAEIGETGKVIPRTAAAVLADIIRPPEHGRPSDRTALAEAEHAAQLAGSTRAMLDPLLEVVAEHLTGRTGRLLDQLAATGELPEHHRIAVASDEARGSLDALLRRAELAGHDPARVLRDAVAMGSLDGSASVAQVLHFRIRANLDDDTGALATEIGGYRNLLPTDLPATSQPGLEALADAADLRREELARDALEQAPQWAVEALGPIPDDELARQEWAQSAGWAASYRELADHTDPADALGVAPPAGLAERHAIFRTAHAALDLPGAGAEEEAMTEGRLRARVAAYQREENWAPRYVADELAATHDRWRQRDHDATVWAARADAEPDPAQATHLRTAADEARTEAAQLAAQVTQLEHADDARAAWWIETAVTRDNAERARYALGLRGIPLEDPAERTTATEWLDAEHAAREADDTHRDIHDDELAIEHEPISATTEAAVDLEPGDIRDSQPDAHEHSDPVERRRVPLPDDTAVTVDRAQAALAEIARRAAVEREAAAHAAELEPDEDARRSELARWADEPDEQTAEHDQGWDDDLGSEP